MDLLKEDHQGGMCGRLKKATYGTRDAAQNWELETQGSHSTCVFCHEEIHARSEAHGDGFTVPGARSVREVTQRRMEVMRKARLEGKRPGAVRILNRIVTVTNGGLEYEAGHRLAEILMRDMGIDEGSRGVTSPRSNGEGGQDAKGDKSESRYRAVAARGNNLGQDRMDIQFADVQAGGARLEGDKETGEILEGSSESRAGVHVPEVAEQGGGVVGHGFRRVREGQEINSTSED